MTAILFAPYAAQARADAHLRHLQHVESAGVTLALTGGALMLWALRQRLRGRG